MGRYRMFTAEKTGFLVLAASIIAFCCIAMTKRCSGTKAPDTAHSTVSIIDSLSALSADTAKIKPTTAKPKKKFKETTKKNKKKKESANSFSRHHLSEPAE